MGIIYQQSDARAVTVCQNCGRESPLISRALGLCLDCIRKDKKLRVKIPAGVKTDTKVKLRNARQTTDGQPGDIVILVNVR